MPERRLQKTRAAYDREQMGAVWCASCRLFHLPPVCAERFSFLVNGVEHEARFNDPTWPSAHSTDTDWGV